jgi:hypothetical protein
MPRIASRPSLRDTVTELRREVRSLQEQLNVLTAEIRRRPAEQDAQGGAAAQSDRGRAELEWLSAHIQDIAARHRGEAIAIAGQRVVASGPDMETVVRQAMEAGYPDALFTGIPKDPPSIRI